MERSRLYFGGQLVLFANFSEARVIPLALVTLAQLEFVKQPNFRFSESLWVCSTGCELSLCER